MWFLSLAMATVLYAAGVVEIWNDDNKQIGLVMVGLSVILSNMAWLIKKYA